MLGAVVHRGGSPRVLSFIDWTGARDRLEGARFDALQSFMLVALVAHCGMLLGSATGLGWWARTVFAPALVMSSLLGLGSPRARPYCVMASFGVTSLWLVVAWPGFANHLFLEWSVLLFLTLCRNDPALGMKAIRWLAVIVLFHSGFQKLVMGHYFEGQFLAVWTARHASFQAFFGLVLSDAELGRLVAMEGRIGTGPYHSTNPLFLAMSNAVWIGEMGLAALLLVSRTRKFAVWGALALLLGIELGAREVVFGCLFSFLVLMFHESRRSYALWPALAAVQVLAMLADHLLPGLGLN